MWCPEYTNLCTGTSLVVRGLAVYVRMLVFAARPYTHAHTRLHAVPVAVQYMCLAIWGPLSECITSLCESSEDLHYMHVQWAYLSNVR